MKSLLRYIKAASEAAVTQATTSANAASKPVVNLSSTPQQMQASHKAEAQRAAQKCVSNPILTPVTDEMPTEDRGGDWVAPEIMEEKQQKTKAAPQAHKVGSASEEVVSKTSGTKIQISCMTTNNLWLVKCCVTFYAVVPKLSSFLITGPKISRDSGSGLRMSGRDERNLRLSSLSKTYPISLASKIQAFLHLLVAGLQ
ncbi:unnamed protein product [Cylicostephanus goldi]|uniref:Uncharacterized protein n=1 Tax=Cylicostephanus goldi TaxID=71465 RepID=A0A3P7QV72_CYLGO|nr:unnamed protein product [Cylicostephanus goldi]